MKNPMQTQNKVAIVTGASRGIGFSVAKKLLESGYRVVGICRNINDEVLTNWQLIGGGPDLLFSADISKHEEVEALLNNKVFQSAQIELLVNNAGITRDAFFHKMTFEQWSEVIDVNLKSIFFITQLVYRTMMVNKYGRIINISSVNGEKGQAGQTNYSASKAGIHGFTMSLAQEACRHNITVNTVSPGYTDTSMTSAINPEIADKIKSDISLKRFAHVDEIAAGVLFLASREASYITGANLSINGGLYFS